MGATYDRTHTLMLDEMGGVGQKNAEDFRHVYRLFDGFPRFTRDEWFCCRIDGICRFLRLAMPIVSQFK